MSTETSKVAGAFQTPSTHLVGRLGAEVWAQWDELRYTAAVIGTVLCICVRPRHWLRTVRKAFALQILSIGVEPVWFVGALAVFVGISVVVHFSFWVGEAGQLGWIVAEVGRQPWIVYGMLKTKDAVSKSIDVTQVLISLICFTLLYGSLGVVDIYLLSKYAKQGPMKLFVKKEA